MPRRIDITTTDCQTRAETPYIFSQKTRSQAPQTLLPVNEVLHSLTSADQQVTKLIVASHHSQTQGLKKPIAPQHRTND
jgi:hypothetical protein